MTIIIHVIIFNVNNVLFVDKPKGMTSFDVCFKLRKILKTKKIGHTGTLDPLATGVMVVLFDNATKANQFLVSDRKTYETRVMLGISTDTLDTDGNIIEKRDFILPSEQLLKEVLESFKGISMQEVPLTSAVKVDGKRLYQYQLKNIPVEVPTREIEVYDIELNRIFDNGFVFTSTVSSGTYIRALVRDILRKLDLIGCVSYLRRLAIDDITIDECDSLDDILNGRGRYHDIYELLSKRYPVVEYEKIDDIKNGKKIKIDHTEDMILIAHENEALAIYQKDNDQYKSVRGLW